MFFIQLDRFGYMLTAIGKTRNDVKKTIMDEYKRAYKNINGCGPSRRELDWVKEEAVPQEIKCGEVLWL